MKEITAFAAALLLVCKFGAIKAHAWGGDVHRGLTRSALELLEKEKKLRPAAFYKDWHEQIIKGCTQPDGKGDMDKGPGKHYYSAFDPKGRELPEKNGYYRNRLKKLIPSARTLYCANYTSALSLYKSGNTEEAMRFLGRAVHFVEDMGCTPHVANLKMQEGQKNPHYAFEKRINSTHEKFTAETFDKRLVKAYEKDDPGEAFNKLVHFSGKFVKTILHLDPRAFDDTAAETLPYTAQNVMAVLLKFYEDCNSDKGNFVADGRVCQIRNEASGRVLTLTKRGLTMADPDSALAQRFTLCLDPESGCFGFMTGDGGFISSSLKGAEHPSKESKPPHFRLHALGGRRFYITTEGSDFTKVMAIKRNGKLTAAKFVPGSPLQTWIIA
ncbi:MAG: phospholipase [Ruminococcus sp.]|nr:phospholipase [Ruminococcus sp.]